MRPWIYLLFTLTAAGTAALGAGCEAELTQECLGGACLPAEQDSIATNASSAAATTSSGSGGGAVCGIDTCVVDQAGPAGTLPPCIEQILADNCQRCHDHDDPSMANPNPNGAPFALRTYEDTQELYFGTVTYFFMHSATLSGRMPQQPPPLSPTDFATLQDWLCACAPSAESYTCPEP